MRIVQKYGGTSLATPDRIFTAARRAAELFHRGHQVALVVSAPGDTTDALLQAARQIDPAAAGRALDLCLASGEQISAAMVAMALEQLGVPAVGLTGWQAGLLTDDNHGNAQILGLQHRRLELELEQGRVPVVTGFQGISTAGDITTLGRGGSDTSAVALAAFLQADKCLIYTDVDGVYDKDPQKYADGVKYRYLSYDAMLELIGQGAQVLHDRSVLLAQKYGLRLEVLSAATGKNGTVVGPAQ